MSASIAVALNYPHLNMVDIGFENVIVIIQAIHDNHMLERNLYESLSDPWLLSAINWQNDPAKGRQIDAMLESGMTPDQIAAFCDELGVLKYSTDGQDPNALVNRFVFTRLGDPVDSLEGKRAAWDGEYYAPSVDKIRRFTGLQFLQIQAETYEHMWPKLETAQDYFEYFATFPEPVLIELFKNLYSIALNDGCSAACRDMCIFEGPKVVKNPIPFEVVEYMLVNYGKYLRMDKTFKPGIMMYGATDMLDYEDGDKRIEDVLELYIQYVEDKPATSFAFRGGKRMMRFIKNWVVRGGHDIDRLSRLANGHNPESLENFLALVRKSLWEDGLELDEVSETKIRKAFEFGEKNFSTNYGQAIKPGMPESEMGNRQIPCYHGVEFEAGRGFVFRVLQPTSAVVPFSNLKIPVLPNEDNVYLFPKVQFVYKTLLPGSFDQLDFVTAPRFMKMSAEDGSVVSVDPGRKDDVKFLSMLYMKSEFLKLREYFELKPDTDSKCEVKACYRDFVHNLRAGQSNKLRRCHLNLNVAVSQTFRRINGILVDWPEDGRFEKDRSYMRGECLLMCKQMKSMLGKSLDLLRNSKLEVNLTPYIERTVDLLMKLDMFMEEMFGEEVTEGTIERYEALSETGAS